MAEAYCDTCKGPIADEDDAQDRDDLCYSNLGGDHAETDEWSNDWSERAVRAERALAAAEEARRVAEAERDRLTTNYHVAVRDIEGLTRDVAATRREADRLRHGEPIESDFICPDALERDAAIARAEAAEATLAEARAAWAVYAEARTGAASVTDETWEAAPGAIATLRRVLGSGEG